jgi:hypothetical protein
VNGLSRADAEGLAKVLAEGLGHKKKAHALSLWHQGGGGRTWRGRPTGKAVMVMLGQQVWPIWVGSLPVELSCTRS